MKLLTIVLPGFLAFSSFASAADKAIYKCADPEGVAYRDTPCVKPHGADLVVVSRQEGWQSARVKANVPLDARPVDARLAESPLYAPRLFIGMTDTQVLNLPSWGRPARIVRSKEGHLWREQWIYKDRSTGDERRFLYFENARLVDQEDAPTQPLVQVRANLE